MFGVTRFDYYLSAFKVTDIWGDLVLWISRFSYSSGIKFLTIFYQSFLVVETLKYIQRELMVNVWDVVNEWG